MPTRVLRGQNILAGCGKSPRLADVRGVRVTVPQSSREQPPPAMGSHRPGLRPAQQGQDRGDRDVASLRLHTGRGDAWPRCVPGTPSSLCCRGLWKAERQQHRSPPLSVLPDEDRHRALVSKQGRCATRPGKSQFRAEAGGQGRPPRRAAPRTQRVQAAQRSQACTPLLGNAPQGSPSPAVTQRDARGYLPVLE